MEDNSYLKFLINEDLYLVDLNKSTSEVREPAAAYPSGLDKEASDVLIVLENPKDQNEETFRKILKAINVDQPLFGELSDLDNHKKCLIFEDSSAEDRYLVRESNGVKILRSHTIKRLDADQKLKLKLWDELKALFLPK